MEYAPVENIINEAAEHYETAKDIREFLESKGAVLINNDGPRIILKLGKYLIKVSRDDRKGWSGDTYLAYENTAEKALWEHVRTHSPDLRALLNPVIYLTRNNRIMIMPYLDSFILTTDNTLDYTYYERELSRVHGFFLTRMEFTSSDYKQIHYPHVHVFPSIPKLAP